MADENLRGIFWFVMKIYNEHPYHINLLREPPRVLGSSVSLITVQNICTSIHTEDENVPVIQS